MSPRPVKLRKVSKPPLIAGMKPYGFADKRARPGTVFLNIEEYESLRLCDFLMLHQCQAANMMMVSRPTLTRIYESARRKIAEAIVTGKQLIIEGGKIYFDSSWFFCSECGCYFNNPEYKQPPVECPLCSSPKISNYEILPQDKQSDFVDYSDDAFFDCRGHRRAGRKCKET